MNRLERTLESGLADRGIPFRTQDRSLPGTPDFVLSDTRIAVFAHGCYWHRHQDCGAAKMPAKDSDSWLETFQNNVVRDQAVYRDLEADGWWVVVAWECEVNRDLGRVVDVIEELRTRRIAQLGRP